MNKPHKHAALIHAWADGAEIQIRDEHLGWVDVRPNWYVNHEYRIKIKPRTVKREGWVNIGKHHAELSVMSSGEIFESKEAALACATRIGMITAKVEWEEEE